MDSRFVATVAPHLKFLGDQSLTPQSRLPDLGLDSMQAIDLLFDLEDRFGVALPDDELNDKTFATAGDLWDAIDRVAGEQGVELEPEDRS